MPRSSKRKRTSRVQTKIPNDDEVEMGSAAEDDGEPELDTKERENQEENGAASRRFEVEADLWDSFREEFHEGARCSSWIIRG